MNTQLFIHFSQGCTYCFLKAINPTIAQPCPHHTKEDSQ